MTVKSKSGPKVVIVAHFSNQPTTMKLPKSKRAASQIVNMFNFTRVVAEDGLSYDHLALLKKETGRDLDEAFSVGKLVHNFNNALSP